MPGGGIQHAIHGEKLACQVCHAAGEYKSCFNCHTARDDNDLPYFTTEATEMTFKIGRNPLQSEDRPWDYVLLRHAPANPDLFAFYGEDLLPEFDNLPTWKYTTPHNVRRITPQNEECDNCHGQEDLFLTEDDVLPELLEANRNVIVEEIPAARGGGTR
jgi:thiosulfate/3-mercaptopyruvate sulfurtransferase